MQTSNPEIGVIANVTGRVQGVGFRYYTKLEADKLNLSGTVQNLDDGSVSIRAYGKPKDLKALINWCKSGPPSSSVDSLEFQFTRMVSGVGFSIIR